MEKITVFAKIQAQPDFAAEVKKALLNCAAATRKEEGCVNYDIHQGLKDPSVFMVHENWADKAALKAHGQTPHMAAMFQEIGDKLAGPPDITMWTELV